MKTTKFFPNGFAEWQETHFEIVQAIVLRHTRDNCVGVVKDRHEAQGHGGLYDLAEELTDKFELMHQNKDDWDGNFLDAMDDFIFDELGN